MDTKRQMAKGFAAWVARPRAQRWAWPSRRGLSFLEVLAVVVIAGIVALVLLPRFTSYSATARKSACYTLKRNIESQAQLWFRNKGTWPATNLSDLGADKTYLPEGLPVCPVDGSAYTLSSTSHRVVGHTH